MTTNGLSDGGVLSHHDDCSVTKLSTDLLHLLGADIVDQNKEHLLICVKQLLRERSEGGKERGRKGERERRMEGVIVSVGGTRTRESMGSYGYRLTMSLVKYLAFQVALSSLPIVVT